VIARLSKKQLEEFHKAVAEGKLSVELELWQPWWKGSHPTVRTYNISEISQIGLF
jgi:hypothetical protein